MWLVGNGAKGQALIRWNQKDWEAMKAIPTAPTATPDVIPFEGGVDGGEMANLKRVDWWAWLATTAGFAVFAYFGWGLLT